MLFLLTRIYELQGRCSRRETFNTIHVHTRVFYGASALFCTPSRHLRDDADVGRRRANDRFAIVLKGMDSFHTRRQSEKHQSLRRRHDEGTKGTRGNGMGAFIRRGFPLCPRCMYTHTHTRTHILRAHLFFLEHPTPNTQKNKEKKRENMLLHLSTARARVKPGFARARLLGAPVRRGDVAF